MKTIHDGDVHIGDKFKLLGMVWTVEDDGTEDGTCQFEAVAGEERIILNFDLADKLEWLDEEKPEELEVKMDFSREMKNEIIKEVLELVAEAVEKSRTETGFMDNLRSKAREI